MLYIKQIILVFSIYGLLLTNSFGCSLALSPIAGFDNQEFVFIGKVIGHTGPYRVDGIEGEVWGIKVALQEKVFLPQIPLSGNFEVFRYWLGADCSYNGIDE